MPLVEMEEDLPVEDIINKSGLIQKIKEKEQETSLAESIFTSLLLTIPLVLCHWLFDYLVLLQFGFEKLLSISRLIDLQGKASLAMFGLTLLTDVYKKSKLAQGLYFLASLWLGWTVISIVNDDGTFGALQKTPGLICTGIILVIQMDLVPASVAVIICLAFNYQTKILGLLASSGLDIGKPEL